jgi:hypothetical protein
MSQLEIAQLSEMNFTQLRSWLNNFEFDAWDIQIASDSHVGKLDALMAQARAEDSARRTFVF